MMKDRLGARAVPIQLPIGAEDTFIGIIDLVEMNAIFFNEDDKGINPTIGEIPAELADDAEMYRHELVEAAAEQDDDLMMKFLEDEDDHGRRDQGRAAQGLHRQRRSPRSSAARRSRTRASSRCSTRSSTSCRRRSTCRPIKGIDLKTDEEVERPADPKAPFAALAFKVMTDPFVGKLTYFRVYSGTLNSGSYVLNSTKGHKERIGRLLQMHANHREDIEVVSAGDIVAAVGLKNTTTGDTLCAEDAPVLLESMVFPDPVIDIAIEPKTKADQDKLGSALAKLAEEDPTFRVRTDTETGQTIIAGMGELHLEVIVDRLLREFKVEANVGKPQVAYRETAGKRVDNVDMKFARQTGGRGQYGHVVINVDAAGAGRRLRVRQQDRRRRDPQGVHPVGRQGHPGGARDRACSPASRSSTSRSSSSTARYHEVDSSEMAFKIAGSMAIKDGAAQGRPVLLEPMMAVEVVTPEEFMGDVIGDLNRRRGHIESMEPRGNAQVIRAKVPLSEMFGYATDLRSRDPGTRRLHHAVQGVRAGSEVAWPRRS